ncbi:unnamed protein product [Caenorhabditis sp. 36 PRJEB53466]|nr:unnamed protein product [Caenorhabditis sp. 36 PRJEB53466]
MTSAASNCKIDLLESPFVSTSTISSTNSVQFEVDIADYVNPPRAEPVDNEPKGYCAMVAKAFVSLFIGLTILVGAASWTTFD